MEAHIARAASHSAASTANRPLSAAAMSQQPLALSRHAARRPPLLQNGLGGRLSPCRLTNTQEELDPFRKDEEDYIDVSQMQIPNPELGPLERRVNVEFLEAIQKEITSQEDMQYWFTPPPGGWNQTPLRLKKATTVPNEWATARNFGAGRASLRSFHEGQEVTGEVTRIMLYSGAQIDFGAEYDGLVPVSDAQWIKGVRDELAVGTRVTARIYAIRDTDWHRFPVQLQLLTPDLGDMLSPPHEHEPPVDLRGKPSSMELYEEKTGRAYNRYRYWIPFINEEGDANEFEYGSGMEAEEAEMPVSSHLQLMIGKAGAGLMD